MGRANTRLPATTSGRGMSRWPFAPWSIRTMRPISTTSMRCRTQSRCSRTTPAASRYPTGTAENDGAKVYRISVGQVPVDGFWSVTVYNKDRYFTPNPQNAYSLNDITARRGTGGIITIQFGGCDAATPNCLPITPGWNYLVRLYRPRDEILSGEWTFPEAQPIL